MTHAPPPTDPPAPGAFAHPERRRMHPDVEQLLSAVLVSQDRMVEVQSAIEALPERIAGAMRAALLSTASDPATWAAASAALQRHAREQAGGWLFGGLRALLAKLALVMSVVGGIYLLGGWPLLWGAVKHWLAGGSPP